MSLYPLLYFMDQTVNSQPLLLTLVRTAIVLGAVFLCTTCTPSRTEPPQSTENRVVYCEGQIFFNTSTSGPRNLRAQSRQRVVASFPVGLEPEGAAISPDGRWVYITSETSSTVSVIDTQTNQVVNTFLVGAASHSNRRLKFNLCVRQAKA